MFPFVTALNSQFLSELYATSAYYAQGYYYVPDDQQSCWPPSNTLENAHTPSAPDLASLPEAEKQENPTRTSHWGGRNRERAAVESSVSSGGLDE